MELKIYTDGGALNNPGPAATAFVVYLDSKLFYKTSARIGNNTNNFAEYAAVVGALGWLIKNKPPGVYRATLHSDSNLLVNQLNGMFKVKNTAIREFIFKIRVLEQELNLPLIYKHIPREQNRLADSLVKKALSTLVFSPA